MEWIFILLAVRRPIWVIAALIVSEATISNFFLFQAGDVNVSSRLVLTLVSVVRDDRAIDDPVASVIRCEF